MPTTHSYWKKALAGGLLLAGSLAAEPTQPNDRYNPTRFGFIGIDFASDSNAPDQSYTSILNRLIGPSADAARHAERRQVADVSAQIFDFPNPSQPEPEPAQVPPWGHSQPAEEPTWMAAPDEADFGFDQLPPQAADVAEAAVDHVADAYDNATGSAQAAISDAVAAVDAAAGDEFLSAEEWIARAAEQAPPQEQFVVAPSEPAPGAESIPSHALREDAESELEANFAPANAPRLESIRAPQQLRAPQQRPGFTSESESPAEPTLAPPAEAFETDRVELEAYPPEADTTESLRSNLRPDPSVLPIESADVRAYNVNSGIAEQAKAFINDGIKAADRGAIYSARAQFVKVLRLISQSLDVESGSRMHSRGLAAGLRALKEAGDFRPGGSQLEANLDLDRIVIAHRTPILKDRDLSGVSPLAAQQAYHAYAEEQLSIAGGNELSAADALYGLGKLQSHLGVGRSDVDHQVGPVGMSLYQAALMVYSDHYMAANELGVLFAKFGQLDDAQSALQHAARVDPRFAEPWLNLARIHRRMGEEELAKLALQEYRTRVASRSARPRRSSAQIEWVDNQTFAQGDRTARRQATPMPAATMARADARPTSQRASPPAAVRRQAAQPRQTPGTQPRRGPMGWLFR